MIRLVEKPSALQPIAETLHLAFDHVAKDNAADIARDALERLDQLDQASEGDPCTAIDDGVRCDGEFVRPVVENCRCFVSPLCNACAEAGLVCSVCGRAPEEIEAGE